jgi:hypothetical protein
MYIYERIKNIRNLKRNITKIIKSNFINIDEYLQDINICFENKNFDSRNDIVSFDYKFESKETMSGNPEFLKVYYKVRNSYEVMSEIEKALNINKELEVLHLYEFYKSSIL